VDGVQNREVFDFVRNIGDVPDSICELPPACAGGFPFRGNLWLLHGRGLSVPGRQEVVASLGDNDCAVVIGVEGGSASLADELGLGRTVKGAHMVAVGALLA